MSISLLMAYVNILVGAAGFTIYGLWAVKWLQRRAWGLAALNGLASLVIGCFAFAYAAMLMEFELAYLFAPRYFRIVLPFVIAIPIWARIVEFRHDQAREMYARDTVRTLMKDADDAS